jgi:hypothetical protein
MSRRPSPLSLICSVSTGLVLLLLASPPARAQEQRKSLLPPEGEEKFGKEYVASRAAFNTINRATEGEKAKKDNADHANAIDMAAKYYTYRLTWNANSTPGEVDKFMNEFFSQVLSAASLDMRKGNPAFSEMYLKALAVRAHDVVRTSQMIAVVNAARMLARLAETGSVEAGDACLEVVNNTNDFLEPTARLGAQYWGLKGLGSLLAHWSDPPLGPDGTPVPVPADRKEKEAKYVEALVATIEKFIPANGKSSAGVAKGSAEELGLQMFRREAVRSLAQYRNPAVDEKGNLKVKSALTLLKVTNDDGLSPPARLDEQMEAAWGLARIRAKGLPAYQPDYAARQIGFVVVQMALNARPPATGKKSTAEYAWKVHAARLADALELMRDDAKGLPNKAGATYVDKVVGQATRVLKDLEAKELSGSGGDLKLWLETNAPPDDTLYKGVADSTVRPLDRPDTPEKPDKPEKPEKPKEGKKPGDKKADEKKPGKP